MKALFRIVNVCILILVIVFWQCFDMKINRKGNAVNIASTNITSLERKKEPAKPKCKIIVVRKGYYLSKIAQELSADMKKIIDDNKIKNPNLLLIGQKLVVAPYTKDNTVEVSWYGKRFHGRKMANGKIYNMHDPKTVAHKLLPFGTKVKLSCSKTGKSIIVIVRDRGPYAKGRHFDLSMAAAELLGIKEMGHAECKVEILN